MAKNKRFLLVKCIENHWGLVDTELEDEDQLVLMHMSKSTVSYLVSLLNDLNRLAEANEEQGLAIMTYLHDNYYDIWEEVNKELGE